MDKFVKGYCWLFGCTKSEAEKAYYEVDKYYRMHVIRAYEICCSNAFYND